MSPAVGAVGGGPSEAQGGVGGSGVSTDTTGCISVDVLVCLRAFGVCSSGGRPWPLQVGGPGASACPGPSRTHRPSDAALTAEGQMSWVTGPSAQQALRESAWEQH